MQGLGCEALLNILSLFCITLNKFNNTGVHLFDSIYHMTLKLFKNRTNCVKMCR